MEVWNQLTPGAQYVVACVVGVLVMLAVASVMCGILGREIQRQEHDDNSRL